MAKTMVILGDSLSAGYGLSKEQSWPAQLQTVLPDWTIRNAAISGDTSQAALKRLPALLKDQPDYVLIEIGGNDGLRGYPIASLKRNLIQLIETTKEAGSQVILMQIRIPPNYGPRYTEQFAALYPELADTYQIPLWPFFMEKIATNPQWMQADGIHPNQQAQPIIRDTMKSLIESLP